MSTTTRLNSNDAAAPKIDRAVADLKGRVATATSAYTDMSDRAAKMGSEFSDFGQGTMEAFVQAGQIFAAETQILFRDMVASGQAAATENLANLRALFSANTPRQQLELRANIARTAAIHAIAETSRFARAYIDMTEKALAPLAERAYLAADKLAFIKA